MSLLEIITGQPAAPPPPPISHLPSPNSAAPRLTRSIFEIDELDETTALYLDQMRSRGEAIHESQVTTLMIKHAVHPDPAIIRRAIHILEHLQSFQ